MGKRDSHANGNDGNGKGSTGDEGLGLTNGGLGDDGHGDKHSGHGDNGHGPGHGSHGHGHHEKPPSIITAVASGLICYVLMFCFCSCYGFILFYDYANKANVGLGMKMSLVSGGVLGSMTSMFSKTKVLMGGPDMNAAIFYGDMVSKMSYQLAKELDLDALPNKGTGARRLTAQFDEEEDTKWSDWFWGNEDLAIEGFKPVWESTLNVTHGTLGDIPFLGEWAYYRSAPERLLPASAVNTTENTTGDDNTTDEEFDYYKDFCSGKHEELYPDQCQEYKQKLRTTTIVLVMACNVLMGLTFALLGVFRLSRYVEFVPRGIVDAFLTCMGYKVFKYALKFCKYKPTIWIPSALVGVPMYFVKANHIGNPCITLPMFISAPIVAFHVFREATDMKLDDAREKGLMFPKVYNENFSSIWTEAAQTQYIEWSLLQVVYPDIVTMIFVLILDALVTGLRMSAEHVPAKIDKDEELVLFGIGNLTAAGCAGITGYTQFKLNLVNFGVIHNLQDRRAGLLYAMLCFITFFTLTDVVNYLPRHLFGSILFFGGSGLIAEHAWGSRTYLSFVEWMQIFVVVAVFISWESIVYAVLMGGFLTGLNFLCKYARLPCISGMPIHGGEIVSRHRHNGMLTRAIQHVANNWAVVVRLKGYCFFASVYQVIARVEMIIEQQEKDGVPRYRRLKFVVFDCLELDGMDASAAKDMLKLTHECAEHGVQVYWSSLGEQLAKDLLARGTIESEKNIFYDLHVAMMQIERKIIEFRDVIQERYRKIHPKFAEAQDCHWRCDNFEPFRDIFPFDAARFGCPWLYCTKKTMMANETVLYTTGSVGQDLFLVHSGAVGLYSKPPKEGLEGEPPRTILTHGWFVNTLMTFGEPTADTAICLEDGELLCWNKRQWWKMVRERPLMSAAITEVILRQTNLDVASLKSELASKVVDVADNGEVDLSHLDVSEADMAAHDIPHDLQVLLDGIKTAQFLHEFKFFEKSSGKDTKNTALPELPHMIADDLEIAFWTYATLHGSKYMLDETCLEEALMYAGIFHTTLEEKDKRAMGASEFLEFGHEKAIARLTKRQVIKMHNLFKKYDKDDSGCLELDEMQVIFQETFSPTISEAEVVGVCGAWDDDGTGTIEAQEFVGILSRFIRKHEQDMNLLTGFREILQKGRHELIDNESKLTPEMLMDSKHFSVTREEAEEMLWACDCYDLCGDGKELDFPGFVSGVMLNVDPKVGKLPPEPKLPPKNGDRDPVAPDFGRRRAHGSQVDQASMNTTLFANGMSKPLDTLDLAAAGLSESRSLDVRTMKSKKNNVPSNTCRGRVHRFIMVPLSSGAAHVYSILIILLILVSCGSMAYSKVKKFEASYGSCPKAFPYPYHQGMKYCCMTNTEKVGVDSGKSCDGSVFHADGVVSKCCEDSKQVKCDSPPCARWSKEKKTWIGHLGSVTAIIFTVEYVARVAVADALGDQSVFDFLTSPLSLVELAAIVPFWCNLAFNTGDNEAFRMLRLVRVGANCQAQKLKVPRRVQMVAPVLVVYVVIVAVYIRVTSDK